MALLHLFSPLLVLVDLTDVPVHMNDVPVHMNSLCKGIAERRAYGSAPRQGLHASAPSAMLVVFRICGISTVLYFTLLLSRQPPSVLELYGGHTLWFSLRAHL